MADAAPPVQRLPVQDFVGMYPPAYYAATWEEIDHQGSEVYDDPDDPDGEFDQRFLAGGDTGIDFDDLVASISTDGIDTPVDIDDGKVVDGHHRVVAAMLTGQDVVFRVWSEGAPMGFGEADDLTQGFLNTAEGKQYDRCCHNGDEDLSAEVSAAFAAHLQASGYPDAVVLNLTAQGHACVEEGTEYAVVRVGGAVVDLLHRRFVTDADVPFVRPEADYLHGVGGAVVRRLGRCYSMTPRS